MARQKALPILAPRWVQLRLGAVLRRERVKRFYVKEFTSRPYIRGIRRALVLATYPKKGERHLDGSNGQSRAVIVFEGLANYFQDIWHHNQLIRQELLSIVAPPILQRLETVQEPFIGMHIRRGDIMTPGFTEQQLMAKKHYTPLSWFVSGAKAIREHTIWSKLPIYIVSDGRASELAELLQLPDCRFVTQGTAIGDILLLSKAKLLFATGHSTFGMWASYLGGMPTLYFPGKLDQNVFPPGCNFIETEWLADQPLPGPRSQ